MPLSDLVASDRIAAVITDARQADNPIIECNDSFVRLTGYGRDEIIGRNCRFLAGPGTDPASQKMVREAIAREAPIVVELLNYRKDGTAFLNSLMIAPIYDEAGKLAGFVGSQFEVNGEPAAFVKVSEDRALALIALLTPRQKEVLAALARGIRIKQMSHMLKLSERTIKMHRAAMLKRLDVASNAEAIRIAVQAGL